MNTGHFKAHLTYAFSEDEKCIHFKAEPPTYAGMTLVYEAEGSIQTYMLTEVAPSVRNVPLSPEGCVVTIYLASHLDDLYCGGIWHIAWSQTQNRLTLACICASDIELRYVPALSSTQEQEQLDAVTEAARLCLRGEWSKQRKDWLYQRVEMVKYEEASEYSERLHRQLLDQEYSPHRFPEHIWKLTFHCYSDEESHPTERQVLACYYRNQYPLCFSIDALGEHFTEMLGHSSGREDTTK